MIENRFRRWSFQFIMLPLLRDDSLVLKSFSTMGRRRSWEVTSNADGTTGTQRRIGEKNYCFQKALWHPCHTRARPLWPRSRTNFVAGRKGLRQALEKFLQFFDKALQPLVLGLQCATTAKSELAYDAPSIIRAYSSSFCSRSGIRKTHATVHIHEVDVCLQCANGGGTNEKYTSVLPLLLSFLRENTFPLNFQRQSCRHV